MRPFAPAAPPVLASIARERTLLVIDVDDVLTPDAGARGEARVPPATRALLRTAALLYPCAVISGRRRAEVAASVAGVPLVAVIGRHGAEPGFGPVDQALAREAEVCEPGTAAALRGRAIAQLRRRMGVPSAVYIGEGSIESEALHLWAEGGAPVDASLRALVVARLEEDGRGARSEGVLRAVGG